MKFFMFASSIPPDQLSININRCTRENYNLIERDISLSESIFRVEDGIKHQGDFLEKMLRAAVSIPSNIAEGYERNTNKDFIHFLHISMGSCSELRTQIYLAGEIGIVDKETFDELLDLTRKISAMLYNFIKTRKERF